MDPCETPRRRRGHEDSCCRVGGGGEGDRTLDLRIANATLSQLSYSPGNRTPPRKRRRILTANPPKKNTPAIVICPGDRAPGVDDAHSCSRRRFGLPIRGTPITSRVRGPRLAAPGTGAPPVDVDFAVDTGQFERMAAMFGRHDRGQFGGAQRGEEPRGPAQQRDPADARERLRRSESARLAGAQDHDLEARAGP